jgi:hypothetical protein
VNSDSDMGVLDRILDPISRSLNLDSARSLATIEADPAVQARVAELAEKCNEGHMTPAEQSEYETYVHAGNLIAILQAKARLYLKQHGNP